MLRMSSNTLDAIHTPSTTLNRLTVNALATPVRKPSAPHQHHHLHPHHHNHSASAMQTPVSAKRMKCWTSAKKHSFYARDNVANFLGWCRTLGVRDVLLFESEDLVLARRPKNVLLCLLEVARIACRHLQLDLSPTLIQLEQEIEMQEQQEQQEQLQQQLQQLTDDQTSDLICPEKIRDYAMSKSACDPSNRNGLIEADKRSSTGSRLDCSDFLLATLPNEPKSFEKCDTTIEQVSFSNAHSRKGAGHEEQVDGDRTTGPKEDGATDGHNDKESDVNSIDSNEENWKYWKAKANEQSEPASNAGIISNTMPLQPLQVVAISPQTARIRLANVVSHVRPALAHLSDTGFTSKLLELQQQAGSENTQRSIACSNNDDVDIEEDDDATAQSLGEDSRSNSNSSIDTQSESKTSNCSQMTISQLDQKVMLIAKSYYGKKVRSGIQRLAEGKYRIAGKIVFVRLLKDRHVMVRVGGGWDTLQHFLERHGADPVQQISAADLLPMDTRPAQCSARKRHPINGSTMNSLSASTMTLNQAAGSHVAAAAAVAHHAAGHGNVLVNSTQQLLGLPIGHLSAAAAVAAAAVSGNNTGVALNGSSNESYSSVTIESNMFNRCVSVTPLLSSPEPASSGYCSSNNSNCTLSISSISKISSTSMAFRRAPSTITSTSNSEPRRRSNSTVSVSTKKSTLSSYKSSATNGSVAHNRYAGSSIPRAHSVLSNNLLSTSQSPNFNAFKVPNRSATKTRIPVLQSPRPESNKSGPTSPGQLQRSRSTSICSPPTTTTHFGFRAGARSALCVRPALAGNPTNVESPTLALNHSTSNNSIIKPANTSRQSRIPTAIGKFGSTSNTNLSGCNRSRIPIFSTGTMSQPTSPSLDKRKSVSRSRRSSANSGPLIGFYSSSNTQLTVSIDSIGSIDSAKTSVRYSNSGSNQSLRRSSTGLTRSLVKLPSTASFHSPTSPSSARSESQPASKGSPSTFGLSNPNSRKKSPASPRLASTSPSVTLNVLGRTSLSAF